MKVTVFSTSANKKDEALSYGAKEFVLSSDLESMKKNEKRFDIVINCAHAGSKEALEKCL